MTKRVVRSGALAMAVAVALAPASSEAIAPVLLLMVKQIAQQAATSMIKDTLLSALSGMGCKGIALSNALAAFDLRGGAGGVGGMLGMLGATLVQEMKVLPADQRAALLEYVESGFFPPRVSDGVKAALAR